MRNNLKNTIQHRELVRKLSRPDLLTLALVSSWGNQTVAAIELGISRSTFCKALKRNDINVKKISENIDCVSSIKALKMLKREKDIIITESLEKLSIIK